MRPEVKCFERLQCRETYESLSPGLRWSSGRYNEWKELSPMRQADPSIAAGYSCGLDC